MTEDINYIAKIRQKISERVAEANGFAPAIPEKILKPEERQKVEKWLEILEADYEERQIQKAVLGQALLALDEAKRINDKELIAEFEKDVDAARKFDAYDSIERSDLALLRKAEDYLHKLRELME
jgi:hypothetical protein